MTPSYDVLVLGAGIVGLSAALAMSRRSYRVALIDAGSLLPKDEAIDDRVYAINPASVRLLQQLNAWPKEPLSSYTNMHIWDHLSTASIQFDCRDIAAPHLGFILTETALKNALLAQIANEPHISLFPGQTLQKIVPQEKSIKIKSQELEWEGQLLMVADGSNSSARQELAIALVSWPYQQSALVAKVATEKPHQQTAYQRFHPDGPLAFLPLNEKHHCSIVWSLDKAVAEHCFNLSEEDFGRRLSEAVQQQLGKIHLLASPKCFPLHMRHVKQYTGFHWLLLGDAAHSIHPLAGLGLNLGLADLACWLKHLDGSKKSISAQSLLGAYQRERKYQVWQMIILMEGLKRLFAHSHAPIVGLRGLGLRMCNELSLIKRFLIQQASGV